MACSICIADKLFCIKHDIVNTLLLGSHFRLFVCSSVRLSVCNILEL